MNIFTMPHSKDHAKQVPQTAVMIKPNLKVQPGPISICVEGGGGKKRGGFMAIFDWLKGGGKLFIKNSKEGSAVWGTFYEWSIAQGGVVQSNHLVVVCETNFSNY